MTYRTQAWSREHRLRLVAEEQVEIMQERIAFLEKLLEQYKENRNLRLEIDKKKAAMELELANSRKTLENPQTKTVWVIRKRRACDDDNILPIERVFASGEDAEAFLKTLTREGYVSRTPFFYQQPDHERTGDRFRIWACPCDLEMEFNPLD